MALMNYITSRITAMARKLRAGPKGADEYLDGTPFDWDWSERRDRFAEWQGLYANTIYQPALEGGMREMVLTRYIGKPSPLIDPTLTVTSSGHRIDGFFNPTKQIVDVYQNAIYGTLGREILVDDTYDGKPVAEALLLEVDNPLAMLWNGSKLNAHKSILCHYAACMGNVGIRIVAAPAQDGKEATVRLVVDNPAHILDFDEDDEGNTIAVLLEYTRLEGPLGENRRQVTIREELTQEAFRAWKDGVAWDLSQDVKSDAVIPNELGVCPYQFIRHSDKGNEWGKPSFEGSEPLLHEINWVITRQDMSIDRHAFATWFATGAGDAPQQFDLGKDKVLYARSTADEPLPTFQAMDTKLDHDATREFWQSLVMLLRERQPELILNQLQVRAGQSGDSIAQLLKPVEQLILNARSQYETGLIRALQIGLQWQVMYGKAEFGTGMGTKESAQRAYENGGLNFQFKSRPALPLTPAEKSDQAIAEVKPRSLGIIDAAAAGDIVDEETKLGWMGFNAEEAAAIMQRRRTVDVIPTVKP